MNEKDSREFICSVINILTHFLHIIKNKISLKNTVSIKQKVTKSSKTPIKIKGSNEILYDLSINSLEHQWDVFKHADTKIATSLAVSGTILSLYLGLQVTQFKIFSNIAIEMPLILFSWILFIGIILFLLLAIYYNFKAFIPHTFHLHPTRLILKYAKTSNKKAKKEITLDLSALFLRNDRVITDKYININKSNTFFKLGISLLLPSIMISLRLSI